MPAERPQLHLLMVSDTHLRNAAALPGAVLALAEQADHIVHAGDHSVMEVIRVLERFAPVTAVCGNVDDAEVLDRLPAVGFVEVAGVRVGVVHDAGVREGRHARLVSRLPDCNVRVYGHSHLPEVVQLPDGSWIVNPGSPTQRRRAPFHSVAWATIDQADAPHRQRVHVDLVDLDAGQPK